MGKDRIIREGEEEMSTSGDLPGTSKTSGTEHPLDQSKLKKLLQSEQNDLNEGDFTVMVVGWIMNSPFHPCAILVQFNQKKKKGQSIGEYFDYLLALAEYKCESSIKHWYRDRYNLTPELLDELDLRYAPQFIFRGFHTDLSRLSITTVVQ